MMDGFGLVANRVLQRLFFLGVGRVVGLGLC